MYLGGLKIPFHSGLQGHSDGDVVLHAIIDGLLGAMRKMDIGTLYPSNKKRYKNIRSPNMLSPVLKSLDNDGYFINDPNRNQWGDTPASNHSGGASFSFSDGHSELRKWLSKTTKIPVKYSWGTPSFDANGKIDFEWWKDKTGFIRY